MKKSRYKSIKTYFTPEQGIISIAFQEKSFTDVKHLTREDVEQLIKNLQFHISTFDVKIEGIMDL